MHSQDRILAVRKTEIDPSIASRSRVRSLVVDDESGTCHLLCHLLGRFGDVKVVINGSEGVSAFRRALDANQPYDLVLLDILMPKMNGIEALREFRRMEAAAGNHRAKVLITTIMGDGGNIGDAKRAGCDAYLKKPIHGRRLIALLLKLGLIDESQCAGIPR